MAGNQGRYTYLLDAVRMPLGASQGHPRMEGRMNDKDKKAEEKIKKAIKKEADKVKVKPGLAKIKAGIKWGRKK